MADRTIPDEDSLIDQTIDGALVIRTTVPAGLNYQDYREYLRCDFYYSCAYCTMNEYEATGLSFCIDHFEPQKLRPDLMHSYYNLMYSCMVCNNRKGSIWPPQSIYERGYRFFRPDEELFDSHFDIRDLRVNPKSNIGEYTIEALDLNRHQLIRLRGIRQKYAECQRQIAQGLQGLRRMRLDKIPPRIRAEFLRGKRQAEDIAGKCSVGFDEFLREKVQSPLLESDTDKSARLHARKTYLKTLKSILPNDNE